MLINSGSGGSGFGGFPLGSFIGKVLTPYMYRLDKDGCKFYFARSAVKTIQMPG